MSDAIVRPPARLNFWDDHWDFRPEDCPCDVDFVAWLDERRILDAAIYHFGTGGHHYVGVECARPERRNHVLAVTAAPQEHDSFVRLVTAHPELLATYTVVFGDIYLLDERLLPEFDVVTLFHLCEFRSDKNDEYGAITDLEVARILTRRLRSGGHILFFPGSFAWHRAKAVVAEWESDGACERVADFRTLVAYRKR